MYMNISHSENNLNPLWVQSKSDWLPIETTRVWPLVWEAKVHINGAAMFICDLEKKTELGMVLAKIPQMLSNWTWMMSKLLLRISLCNQLYAFPSLCSL